MTDKQALFPLKSVLMPFCTLDLQIFEARYLDMISRCFKQDQGFLIVGLESGPETGSGNLRFNATGCEARIIDWQQRENGLLGIRVEGRRRGRARAVEVAADGLVLAEVDWLEEEPDAPTGPEHGDLLALRETLLEHPLAAGMGLPPVEQSVQALAYQLAYLLPFSLEQKAALMEIEAAESRLDQISNWLELMQA